MPKPVIDQKKCTKCKTCIETCPVNVFDESDGKIIVKNPDQCIGCRACEVQCPEDAIKVKDD